MINFSYEVLLHIFQVLPLHFRDFLSLRATCTTFYNALSMARHIRIVPDKDHNDSIKLQVECIRKLCPNATVVMYDGPLLDKYWVFDFPTWALDPTLSVDCVVERYGNNGIPLGISNVLSLELFFDSSPNHTVTFLDKLPIIVFIFAYRDPPWLYSKLANMCNRLGVTPDSIQFNRSENVPMSTDDEFNNKRATIPAIRCVFFTGMWSQTEILAITGSSYYPNLPDAKQVTVLSRRDPSPSGRAFSHSLTRNLSINGQRWKKVEEPGYFMKWERLK